jgi:hypothetical protein
MCGIPIFVVRLAAWPLPRSLSTAPREYSPDSCRRPLARRAWLGPSLPPHPVALAGASLRRCPSSDRGGGLATRGSVGVLPRLTVACAEVRHIGKESNRLDEVEGGLVSDPDDVYIEYRDERWQWEQVLPRLRDLRAEKGWPYLAQASGLSERAVRCALNGRRMSHPKARRALEVLVRQDRAQAQRS